MANPLFGMFGNSPQPQQANKLQQFQQFINNFRGNPQQKVQELLQNGQMTQEQFNQYSNIANQIIGRKGL
jgi:hypothetical protein